MIKRGLSATADKNNKGQTEQVLVATQSNNGIMVAIMNAQMVWSHRQLADRRGNRHSVIFSSSIHLCAARSEWSRGCNCGDRLRCIGGVLKLTKRD